MEVSTAHRGGSDLRFRRKLAGSQLAPSPTLPKINRLCTRNRLTKNHSEESNNLRGRLHALVVAEAPVAADFNACKEELMAPLK